MAKSWGMMMFRHYLMDNKFTSWGDHQPLIPLHNDLARPASVRVAKHRSEIIDLTFTDKYLPRKQMPADYNSRHPQCTITDQEFDDQESMSLGSVSVFHQVSRIYCFSAD